MEDCNVLGEVASAAQAVAYAEAGNTEGILRIQGKWKDGIWVDFDGVEGEKIKFV